MKRKYSITIQINKLGANQINHKFCHQQKFETRLARERVLDIQPLQEKVLLTTSPLPPHHSETTTTATITQISFIGLNTTTIRA